MIHDLAQTVFGYLCHQETGRCWAPGGAALALCQRCTGVYAGAALGVFLASFMRYTPDRKTLILHIIFILQMIPFGLHWIPHGATMRMLTGQLFIYGILYFIIANIVVRKGWAREERTPRRYYLWLAATQILLQVLVRLPFAFAASLIELMALAGLFILAVLFVLTLATYILARH